MENALLWCVAGSGAGILVGWVLWRKLGVSNGQHRVDGLSLLKRWPFSVLKAHPHQWKKTANSGTNPVRVITDRKGTPLARFTGTSSVTLLAGYSWDGNSGPAMNTAKCLRASVLHDVGYLRQQFPELESWCFGVSPDLS